MHSSILYVSRSRLAAPRAVEQWRAIQTASLARNSLLNLTGLLVVTPDYFTQFLQGEKTTAESVMGSIRADARHTDILETQTDSLFKSVQFPEWRMACFSPSSFVSRHVLPLLERNHKAMSRKEASGLIAFMRNVAPEFPTSPSL